jgi:hypothetical protein
LLRSLLKLSSNTLLRFTARRSVPAYARSSGERTLDLQAQQKQQQHEPHNITDVQARLRPVSMAKHAT